MAASEYEKETSDRDNVISAQFDTGTFLQNLGNILKGFVYDSQSQEYVQVQEQGFLNAIGARQILNEIEGRIQNVNASGNLRRDEIANIRQDVWFALCKKLYVNHKKYDLDPVNFRPVLHLVDNNLLIFLSRAENGGFFNKLSNFFQRKETVQQTFSETQAEPQRRRFSI